MYRKRDAFRPALTTGFIPVNSTGARYQIRTQRDGHAPDMRPRTRQNLSNDECQTRSRTNLDIAKDAIHHRIEPPRDLRAESCARRNVLRLDRIDASPAGAAGRGTRPGGVPRPGPGRACSSGTQAASSGQGHWNDRIVPGRPAGATASITTAASCPSRHSRRSIPSRTLCAMMPAGKPRP